MRLGCRRTSPTTWEHPAMDGEAQSFLEGVKDCFSDLKDPRIAASCDHLLIDILAITVLAVICGADDWTDLETFGRLRQEWLKTFLALPNGIPSHDTFRRVLGLLDPRQFAAGLFRWTQALHEATGGKLIAIDGKTLRRSFAKKSGKLALHLVTAWSSENGLTLGQVACEEKSNEITAIPKLLKLLSLRGCTVTIDAMGCQGNCLANSRPERALRARTEGKPAGAGEGYAAGVRPRRRERFRGRDAGLVRDHRDGPWPHRDSGIPCGRDSARSPAASGLERSLHTDCRNDVANHQRIGDL